MSASFSASNGIIWVHDAKDISVREEDDPSQKVVLVLGDTEVRVFDLTLHDLKDAINRAEQKDREEGYSI